MSTPQSTTPWLSSLTPQSDQYPFSFTLDHRPARDLQPKWRRIHSTRSASGVVRESTSWTDPVSGLRVTCEAARYTKYPATDWVLWFENTGKADTPIIEDVLPLDVVLKAPAGAEPFRLHRTNGAPANPTDFEPSVIPLPSGQAVALGGGGGRSSNRDFPFMKVEAGDGSRIFAIGWSGQWGATFTSSSSGLRITAGMELTHFVLHPGERVRTPSILMYHGTGDTREANAGFRRLIQEHYAAKRSGATPQPTLFCNTCFTRGGGWLNECNADNQVSLIKAYAPLGLEALITDAGWFEGGWPDGAGNWTPRRDAYPDGMAPVAQAAKRTKMAYGLWFEPERVVKGTGLFLAHPDWILSDGSTDQQSFLADFGRREVQDYFFDIVKGFMALPGFRVYRQDFNMDPLPNWRHTDTPDRQGITEMKYIEGLYAWWDRIATTWPDSLREECASGGRRIDIETIRRMHMHQATDYWFDDEANQARAWGFSQYLPNGVVSEPLSRLDDYSFHSAMASSLCLGWIADAPGFDTARARELTERYRSLRRLLTGAWYPLLPYSRQPDAWMASQYHRPDLGEGMVLAFRHAESPLASVDVRLSGLTPSAVYELRSEDGRTLRRASGDELMRGLTLDIPSRHSSLLLTYHRVTSG